MRRHPLRTLLVGVVLVLLGAALIQRWGGLAIQGVDDRDEFARTALEQGNQLRLAGLADIVVFVTGYVLAFLGAYGFALRAPGRRGRLAGFGAALVVGGAVADQVENLLLQLGIGLVDLDAPDAVVSPASWLLHASLAAYYMKNFLVLASAVTLLSLGMWALVDRAPSD